MEFTIKTDSPTTPNGINSPVSANANIMFHTFRLDSHIPATPKSIALAKKNRNNQSVPNGQSPITPTTPTPSTPTNAYPSSLYQLPPPPQHPSYQPYQYPYAFPPPPYPTTRNTEKSESSSSPTILIPAPKKNLPQLLINTKKRPRTNGLSVEMMGADDDMCESPIKRVNYTPHDDAESGRESCDDQPKKTEHETDTKEENKLTALSIVTAPTLQDPMAVSPASPTSAVGQNSKSAFKKRAT